MMRDLNKQSNQYTHDLDACYISSRDSMNVIGFLHLSNALQLKYSLPFQL